MLALQVLPLPAAKEAAIKSGVATLLGSGVQASDIGLTVESGANQVRQSRSPHSLELSKRPLQVG